MIFGKCKVRGARAAVFRDIV